MLKKFTKIALVIAILLLLTGCLDENTIIVHQYNISDDGNLGSAVFRDLVEGDKLDFIEDSYMLNVYGYTFDHWSDPPPDEMPRYGLELIAYYRINTYTVTYVDNEGTVIQTENIDYHTSLSGDTAPIAPEKEGYTFDSWDTVLPDNMPSENLVITAVYSANTYTLTYIDNEAAVIQTESLDYNTSLSEVTAPSVPEKEGYTFDGWDTVLPDTMPAGNLDITAVYTPNTYSVTYLNDEGEVLQTESLDYDTSLSGVTAPSAPERVGYTFDSWDTVLPDTMPAENIVITSVYTPNTYTVWYMDYEEEVVIKTENFDYGTSLSETIAPIAPEKEGYTFDGWDTVLPDYMPAEDILIKAVYSVNTYTLTYVDNEEIVIQTESLEYNDLLVGVIVPTAPEKEGYTFDSWDTILPDCMPAEDILIKAVYTPNTYTLTYIDNEGEVLQTENFEYDASLSEVTAPTAPEKVGYTFDHWDGTLPDNMPAEDIVITAVYTTNTYTVTYVDNEGTVIQTESFDYDTSLSGVTAPTAPEKDGYTFGHWDSPLPDNMPAEDIIITAVYTTNIYTVTYVDNEETVIQTESFDYDTSLSGVTAPTATEKDGYTFDHWDNTLPDNMPAEDIIITAVYTTNTYTLTYVDNEEAVIQIENFAYDASLSEVTAPTAPEREGYTFDGWDAILPDNMPAENLVLTAVYKINTYTVTYEDEEVVIQTENFDYGTSLSGVTAPTAPEKVGYTFDHWDSPLPENMPAENVVITAVYTTNEYTVMFETFGGTNIESMTQEYQTELIAPEDPILFGYTFEGWYIEDTNNVLYDFTTMPAENILLYAEWTFNQYTVTYVDNEEAVIQTESFYYSASLSGATIPTAPEKEGYTFDHWDATLPDYMPPEDIVITAVYTANEYTVMFETFGGTYIEDIIQDYQTILAAPEDPTLLGYTFDGWCIDEENNVLYEFTTIPAEDIFLFAKWTINTYTVTYVDNEEVVIQTESFGYDTSLSGAITPTAPEKEGYTFDHWDATLPDYMPADDIVITAVYTANEYTVMFETFGGTYIEDIIQDYQTILAAPEDPTLLGYTFDGWCIDEENNVLYEFTTMPSEDLFLYAKWTINTYTVTYVDNEEVVIQTESFGYDTSLSGATIPSAPEKVGYTFDHWDATLPDYMPAEDIVITAVYATNS